MIFLRYLQGLAQTRLQKRDDASDAKPRVLNVGGGSKDIPVPPSLRRLASMSCMDIDPKGKPDLVCDARELPCAAGAGQYDAICLLA